MAISSVKAFGVYRARWKTQFVFLCNYYDSSKRENDTPMVPAAPMRRGAPRVSRNQCRPGGSIHKQYVGAVCNVSAETNGVEKKKTATGPGRVT